MCPHNTPYYRTTGLSGDSAGRSSPLVGWLCPEVYQLTGVDKAKVVDVLNEVFPQIKTFIDARLTEAQIPPAPMTNGHMTHGVNGVNGSPMPAAATIVA